MFNILEMCEGRLDSGWSTVFIFTDCMKDRTNKQETNKHCWHYDHRRFFLLSSAIQRITTAIKCSRFIENPFKWSCRSLSSAIENLQGRNERFQKKLGHDMWKLGPVQVEKGLLDEWKIERLPISRGETTDVISPALLQTGWNSIRRAWRRQRKSSWRQIGKGMSMCSI